MSDPKREDTFKVIDRRLFTADGQLRQEAVEEQQREQAVAAAKKSAGPSSPAPADAPKPSPGFKTLLAFLARNAELILAGMPDPRTGQVMVDIEGLRQIIEMFDALREKTEGKLAPEEDQMLQDVIGDLKYTFVQLNQSAVAAQAGPRNPTSRKP